MPELPEVETVARTLAPLVGRRIVSAEFRCLRILRGGDPGRMSGALAGKRIAGVKRFGKFLVLTLGRGGFLLIHLGMTGRLTLGGALGKHTHAIFTLDRGALLYDDSRQFGAIEYSAEFPKRVARLGPEPLEISADDFAGGMKRRHTSVKALLLNQAFVRGIGNIYADEALHRAGIHPKTLASRVGGPRARRLHAAIGEVLREAIEAGGSSISDYVDAEGRRGFFQFQHRVYQRTGEPCPKCGAQVKRIVVAQRSSHFCPRCQKR
jgi:formamidopyrimidine-DNA glycosylase